MVEGLKGYEAFKIARENTGFSSRQFAKIADISPSMLVYYENGKKSLLGINVKKAIEIFEILGISIHDFYMEYYYRELDVSKAIEQWKYDNPREYSIKKIQQRIKNRLFKLKERGRVTTDMYEVLMVELQTICRMLESNVGSAGFISDEIYEKHVLELEYCIGKCLEANLSIEEQLKNEAAIRINDCILRSDYSYKDLAAFVGITNRRLSNCKNAESGYEEMKIENALRICNVFSKRFEDIFSNNEIL